MFSPPAWGWSGIVLQISSQITVLPTRVGMVRIFARSRGRRRRSPHPRGDGPVVVGFQSTQAVFSPPAWGWSAVAQFGYSAVVVLPTRVGMVRRHRPKEEQ